jgi:hypothetical protein
MRPGTQHRIGAELQRVEEVVVHTTVDDVDAAWSPGRAHEDLAADALQVAPSTSSTPMSRASSVCSK